ncbi:MAG: VOC family protein [Acidobacteria bacterium]|nr:VOC family protein [Acidobacteriota bacterium]
MIRLLLLFGAALFAGTSVDSIGITVSDLDRSVEFYTRVLTFERVSEREYAGEAYEHWHGVFGMRARTARLRLGDEFIELTEYLAPQGRAFPETSRANDRWFQHVAIITRNMDEAYALLRKHRVRHASTGPQTLPAWNVNAAGIKAFYFRDPDGHALEVLEFPADKGLPKWHQASDRLFPGIDHTAITVGDTEESLRFYRDALGLRVAGTSENYGPEQERLNNVFGARLRITALRGESGPGVELLEYMAPRDGRAYPAEAKPNDLLHYHTRFLSGQADAAGRALRKIRASFVSPGLIQLPSEYRQALTARDPDGHAIQIAEPIQPMEKTDENRD